MAVYDMGWAAGRSASRRPARDLFAQGVLAHGSSPHGLARHRAPTAGACGAIAAGLAALALLGWWADIEVFRSGGATYPPLRPNAALIVLLTGCSLVVSAGASRRLTGWLPLVLTAAATLLAAASASALLVQGGFPWAAVAEGARTPDAQPSLPTLIGCAMAIASVRAVDCRSGLARSAGQAIGLLGLLASLYLFAGYAVRGSDPSEWLDPGSGTGPLAAALLSLLFVGAGPAWPGRSLRWRFAAVGLATIAPLAALMVHQAAFERDRALQVARQQVGTLAILATETQANTIEEAQALLRFVANSAEMRNSKDGACGAYLADIAKTYPWIGFIRLSEPSGRALCANPSQARSAKIEDRPYFIETLARKTFVVSNVIVSRLSSTPYLTANHPILDDRGNVVSVLTVAIKPDVFGKFLSPRLDGEGLSLALIDRTGTLIAHNPPLPDLVGASLRSHPIVAAGLTLPQAAIEMTDLTGADKLVAFAPMPSLDAVLAIGMDRRAIVAPIDRALRDRLVLILVIVAFGFAIGLAGSEFFIVLPLRRLARAARAQRDGHMDHHAFELGGTGEIAQVNAAIAGMVETIAERERRLADAESLFRGVFEGSSDSLSIVRVGEDGSLAFEACNPAAAARFGADAVGAPLYAVVADAAILEHKIRQVISGGATLRFGETMPGRDLVQNEVHLSPLRDKDGKIDRILIGSRDVRHLRKAETDAREANRMLLMAETLAHVGHWRLELPGGRITWSDEMFRIYGLDAQESAPTLGQIIGFCHPDDRQAQIDHLKAAIEHGSEWVHHHRLVDREGGTRYVMTRVLCERQPDGRTNAVFGVTSDVTEARRAETARLAASTLLQVTLDTMDQGLMLVDAENRIRIANRRSLELLDLPPDLMSGEPSTTEVLAFQRERGEFANVSAETEPRLQPRSHGGDFYIYERERPNGTVLEIRTVPLAEGGSVRTYTDITARRRIERAIAESEARYKLLAESSSDVITRMGLDFVRDYVSPSCRQLLGYTEEELTGDRPASIIHPDDALPVYRISRTLVRGECERGKVTYRARHRDGHWIWVEASLTLLRDATGAPQSLVASLRDVTDRKLVDERVAESEVRYRLLAENASDVIMLRDLRPGGRRTYVSPSCKAVLGYDVEECLSVDRASILHPDDLPAVLDLEAQLGPDHPQGTSVHRLRHRDGHWLWVEVVFTYMPEIDGVGPQLIGSVRDVTQRQRQARHLEAAKLAAEAGARAKSEFLANMSHELRTPLTGILGVHDLLRDAQGLNDNERHLVDLAQQAGRSLLAIVNDVLDFSKIEDGHLTLEAIPFDLRELVEDCRFLASRSLGGKEIVIETDIDAKLPARLVGDPGRLRQILLNLTTNAVKFTDVGRVTISARCRSETGSMRIAVSDTGIGMHASTLPLLFERFTQADASTTRRFGGTGLGLAICKRLVTLMGGEIAVTSEPGRGSTFTIDLILPVYSADSAAPHETAEPQRQPSAGFDILLAEDNSTNQEIISTVLRRQGHRVTVVDNGASAVAAVSAGGPFDVLLMDMQMPVMDGIAAAVAIRLLERGEDRPTLPIIALTANALREDIQRCTDAGMTMHVAKPIDWAELFGMLARLRDHAEAEIALSQPSIATVLSTEVLDDLADFIGADRVTTLLVSFATDTRRRIAILDAAVGDQAELSSQAHSMLSLAGQLGFLELAGLCREIQDRDDFDPSVDRIAQLRDVAARALHAAETCGQAKVA